MQLKFSEACFQNLVDFSVLDQTVDSAIRVACQQDTTLYLFFQRYTFFNAFASATIARLASSIGLSRYMFNNPLQPVVEEADRGMEVAMHVLAAAADEGAGGVCHRSLAQLTLQTLGDFAGLSAEARNQIAKVPDWLNEIVQALVSIYQGIPGNRSSLIQALGVHAASELLGDRENAVIDRIVRIERCSEFYQYLQHQKPFKEINGHRFHPWAYILIHGSHNKPGVEADHFDQALAAINLCLQYEPEAAEIIQSEVLTGFQAFVNLQQRLFQQIESECINLQRFKGCSGAAASRERALALH